VLNELSIDYFTSTLYTRMGLEIGCGIHPTSYPMCIEGKAARGVKLTTHLQLVPRRRKCTHMHSPVHLHGVVFNKLSTEQHYNYRPLSECM
jgi:hypothetical protein